MEDGGIAYRLEGQLRFHVWQKCWTISAEALWVGVSLIEMDLRRTRSCWWSVGVGEMNQMNELNQAFEDYFLNSNNIWTV